MRDINMSFEYMNYFDDATELEINILSDHRCWFCYTPIYPRACFVVSPHDPAIDVCISRCLFPPLFRHRTLRSKENGIAFCPSCRDVWANTNNNDDPWLVIVPSDLKFFINHEKEDYARRTRLAESGIRSSRSVPSAEMYHAHQIEMGKADPSAIGGLYKPVILMEWFSLMYPNVVFPGGALSRERPWHGDPLTMIRRSMNALGTMRINKFPDGVYADLHELRAMYARPAPTVASVCPLPQIKSVLRPQRAPNTPAGGGTTATTQRPLSIAIYDGEMTPTEPNTSVLKERAAKLRRCTPDEDQNQAHIHEFSNNPGLGLECDGHGYGDLLGIPQYPQSFTERFYCDYLGSEDGKPDGGWMFGPESSARDVMDGYGTVFKRES